MHVKITRLGAATYLSPDFSLIADKLTVLRDAVGRARSDGALEIVLALDRVPLLDSAGLTYVRDLSNELRQAGGSLKIVATDICRDIFAITRLDRAIPVFGTIEEAGRSFL